MRRVCIIGTGYVGLVTAAGLAELGHRVTGIDIDADKIECLRLGELPFFEPDLDALVARNQEAGRLDFTIDFAGTVPAADFIYLAVPTPEGSSGQADLCFIRAAASELAGYLKPGAIVIDKSTVPPGTAELLASRIHHQRNGQGPVRVVSSPEFLREGSAVADFFDPDRIVVGSQDRAAAEAVAELYAALDCPIVITDPRTAETIKYAANAFLATKISFINEIAQICERIGADVTMVAQGMGYDRRIGHQFLQAGLGYGGSCFPKDVKALEHIAATHGCHPQLLRSVMEINRDQRLAAVRNLRRLLGRLEGCTVGLLGLAFKPNTDDMRGASAVHFAHLLSEEGCQVAAYDPVAMDAARRLLPDLVYCSDSYEVAGRSDALVLVTEWDEFRQLDLPRLRSLMRTPIFLDGRNLMDPARMHELGFVYLGVGRGYNPLHFALGQSDAAVKARTDQRDGVVWLPYPASYHAMDAV